MSESERSDYLAQFTLLMSELLQGGTRCKFRPWEIDILLDIESCKHHQSAKILREYQKEVRAKLQQGADIPLKLSEYLAQREADRTRRKSTKQASHAAVNLRLNTA
jgi:hypothetical protein